MALDSHYHFATRYGRTRQEQRHTSGRSGFVALHCEIHYRNHEFVLHDANSTNGTLCNGELISQERVLEFGDRIQVSDTVMEFTAAGYESKDGDPAQAIADFEKCLEREPNFLLALKNLAFFARAGCAATRKADPLEAHFAAGTGPLNSAKDFAVNGGGAPCG